MSGIELVLIYGSVFSPIIPILFFFKKQNLFSKVISIFVLVSFASDLYSLLAIKLNWTNDNHNFLSIYGLIESIILILFFYYILEKPKWLKITSIVFLLFYLIDFIFLEFNSFNSFGRGMECGIIIFLSITYFYKIYTEEQITHLERFPVFWFVVALLVYFSGGMFTLVLGKIYLGGVGISWKFHNASNILKNIIIAIGFYKLR